MSREAIRNEARSQSLDPRDFSFHGFGKLTRDEVRRITRLRIRTGEPALETVEEAIYVPEHPSANDERTRLTGGIVHPDGRAISSALRRRKGGKQLSELAVLDSPAPHQSLEEEVVYLGPLFNHYGRVLLESLARVWYLKHADPHVRVIFTNANSAQGGSAPWLPTLLREFGISPERIWSSTAPVWLQRAVVPEPLFEQFDSAHAMMAAPFHELGERIAGNVTTSDQPLYLSRRSLSSRQRPVIGEVQLEEVLRQSGFRIVFPELLALTEQIRAINEHRHIFSPVGSAAHTILFAIRRPSLHLFARRDDIPANYFLCSALVEAPTTLVNCIQSAGTGNGNSSSDNVHDEARAGARTRSIAPYAGLQARPQLLDFEAAIGYLREGGFVRAQTRTPGRDVHEQLGDQFDESWAYARVRRATGKSSRLPTDTERAVLQRAARSWPVSLMLARYYVRAEIVDCGEAMARQFVSLFEQEMNLDRLAYYRADTEALVPRVARSCAPDLAAMLKHAVASRWPSDTRIPEVRVVPD